MSTVISVVEHGNMPFACSVYAADLRTAMLCCLSTFETLHRNSGDCNDTTSNRSLHKLWDDESAFALALDSNIWSHLPLSCTFRSHFSEAFVEIECNLNPNSYLFTKAAFATYVISNIDALTRDRLLCVEAWNYLRDSLLITLPQVHKTNDQIDQTTKSCIKNICRGMVRILKQGDETAGDISRALIRELSVFLTLATRWWNLL